MATKILLIAVVVMSLLSIPALVLGALFIGPNSMAASIIIPIFVGGCALAALADIEGV